MKTLIVEDYQADADMIARAIRKHTDWPEPVIVSTVSDARAAIKEYNPDVITLDSKLPDASVNNTVRIIEEFKMLAGIIVLTGQASESQGWAARHAGADDYLSKSSLLDSPQTLIDAIRAARGAFRYRTVGENGGFKKSNMTKSQRITALEIEKYTIEEPKFEPTPKEILLQASPVERHLLESRDVANTVLAHIVRGLNINTNVTFKNKRATERVSASMAQVKSDLGKEQEKRKSSDGNLEILMDRNALLDNWLERVEKLLARIRLAAEYCAKNFLKVLGLTLSGALAIALVGWVWTHCFHTALPEIPR